MPDGLDRNHRIIQLQKGFCPPGQLDRDTYSILIATPIVNLSHTGPRIWQKCLSLSNSPFSSKDEY